MKLNRKTGWIHTQGPSDPLTLPYEGTPTVNKASCEDLLQAGTAGLRKMESVQPKDDTLQQGVGLPT